MGEEKRHEMMQNLFGDQSEEEEEIDSEHESNPHPNYASDEAEGVMEPEGEGEGEVEVEGHGEAEVESDGDLRDLEPDPGESEGERVQSSQEVDIGDQREESEAKETDSDEKEDYGQRVVTSRRREVIESGSERSEENHYPDNEDEEVDQTRSLSKSPEEEKDPTHLSHSAAEIRDVFGASDEEEEEAEYAVRHDMEQEEIRSPMEEEGSYGKSPRLEDMVHDEDARYESDDELVEVKQKEKPVGPPLELEVPFRPAPAHPTKYESNARFVRWSDGSLQLLIGNEVLDISVQEAQHDQSHLFLRHGKGILQSQGRILSKMRFMPSSLSSNSHRLLTALVDSHHKKVYKVKNCITDVDPEREKEEKEKAENQTIRANVLLNRKREKVNRKYTQTVERKRQLSTGYLEGALDEDDEMDYNDSRRSRRRFEEDLEVEARAEKRIMNAKKSQGYRDVPRKSSVSDVKSSRRPISFSESDREESEYETEGEEDERSAHNRIEDEEPEYEESEEEEEEERYEEADANANRASEEEEEVEEPRQKVKESVGSSKRKGIESDEDSPPRKAPTHRRMAVVYDSDEE
ncbi:protein LEO1 homolog isoform X2 [Gossypium hirsutum]|uniref:Protein LEO1 homolog isoform X2 n=1 Tax=Gossypium hirsutum TaxID=3635 RepID=A0A1U8NUM5_GOSHI|nr:protein LEO1 homolog isoform X2 [Gossypium hirsutum]